MVKCQIWGGTRKCTEAENHYPLSHSDVYHRQQAMQQMSKCMDPRMLKQFGGAGGLQAMMKNLVSSCLSRFQQLDSISEIHGG